MNRAERRQFNREAGRPASTPDPGTYWNGEPTPCRHVAVVVGKSERPTWWCADLEGTTRRAVEVQYGEMRYLLDDEDGSAWAKVTEGQGLPHWSHRDLPLSSTVMVELLS